MGYNRNSSTKKTMVITRFDFVVNVGRQLDQIQFTLGINREQKSFLDSASLKKIFFKKKNFINNVKRFTIRLAYPSLPTSVFSEWNFLNTPARRQYCFIILRRANSNMYAKTFGDVSVCFWLPYNIATVLVHCCFFSLMFCFNLILK